MATTNPSLFGMLGDEQFMQRQLDEQRAKAFAEQTQEQRLAGMGYSAGAQLGRGLAGAFGVDVTDPTIKMASQLRGIAAQYDTTTPEGLRKYAMAIKDLNPTVALQASQMATEMEDKLSTIANRSMTDPQKNAARLNQLDQLITKVEGMDQNDSRVKETLKNLKNERGLLFDLTEKTKKTSVVGVTKDTGQAVYEDDKGQFIYSEDPKTKKQIRVPYSGGVDRSTAKTSISVDAKGRTAFAERMSIKDADRVDAAIAARETAYKTIQSLDRLAQMDDSGLISGVFASGRVGVTNLLDTLGLTSPEDKTKLAASQDYQKTAGDVVLGTLGGKLGTGFSNEDRDFVKSLVPQLETSPKARRQLIEFMRKKNFTIAEEATRLEKYARKNEGLGGFEPTIPFSPVPSVLSGMSADALAAKAGGKIVNGVFVPNK